jgi:hypothetical protein
MTDDRADQPQDAYRQEAAALMAPSLAAPAQWLDPVESASASSPADYDKAPNRVGSMTVRLADLAPPPEADVSGAIPSEAAYTQETLAELAPAPDAQLWDEVTAEHSVHALRSLLLGSDAPDLDARLAAMERRLDTLAADRANSVVGEARLGQIEQRLEMLTARLEDVYDSARAGDVTLSSLTGLQRQLEELRLDHVHATTTMVQQIKQTDDRCRLRQRRARIASRPELHRLRRRLYAQGLRVPGPVAPVVIPGATPVQGTRGALRTPAPAPQRARVVNQLPPDGSQVVGKDVDVRGAWRAVRRSGTALLWALFVLTGLLAHLAWEDLKAAWQHLNDLFRGEKD